MKSRETDTPPDSPASSLQVQVVVVVVVAFSKVVADALPNWQCLHHNLEARAEGLPSSVSCLRIRNEISTVCGSIREQIEQSGQQLLGYLGNGELTMRLLRNVTGQTTESGGVRAVIGELAQYGHGKHTPKTSEDEPIKQQEGKGAARFFFFFLLWQNLPSQSLL